MLSNQMIYANFASKNIQDLVYLNEYKQIVYSDAVEQLFAACLNDFDDAIYRNYVDSAKYRSDLLELQQGKLAVANFSKEDLQLLLVIVQKAEAIMPGEKAKLIGNGVLNEIAIELLDIKRN